MKQISITNYIKDNSVGYRTYWNHENKNKNSIVPCEGLKVVERKILFAAKMLNLSTENTTLTRKLASDTGLYHISGEASVQDTIKSMASIYKRQPECCLLKGDGAFPTSPSNKGAAARYTEIYATPLSRKIFEDIDYCPWIVDDSGVEQVQYIVAPMPLVLIKGYKGIGVGRATFYCERPHDEVFEWSKKIIDLAFPDKEGSHWNERFLNRISQTRITSVKNIREFYDESVIHDEAQNIDEISKNLPPKPFNFGGAIVDYDYSTRKLMMYPKIETECVNRITHYYITALPIETSDALVLKAIEKKYSGAVLDKCQNCTGEDYPVKLEIPKSIATNKKDWIALKMQKGFSEAYGIWDEELDTVHFIANLYPILIEWFTKREEVVCKRLYHDIANYNIKIYNNNLIKQYYDYDQQGKIHNEQDVFTLFKEDDAKYLINLPEKMFIKENVEKLNDINASYESKISEVKNNILNIKEYVFNEWKDIATKNKKFIEG